MNESTTAGPAVSAATAPVRTNIPAPMVPPTPKQVRLTNPSDRGNFAAPVGCSAVSVQLSVSAARRSASIDLRANNPAIKFSVSLRFSPSGLVAGHTVHHCSHNLDVLDLARIDLVGVLGKYNIVSKLARRDGPFDVFLAGRVCAVERVDSQRFSNGD